jgi:hypothetical protein
MGLRANPAPPKEKRASIEQLGADDYVSKTFSIQNRWDVFRHSSTPGG